MPNALTKSVINRPTNSIYCPCSRNRETREK